MDGADQLFAAIQAGDAARCRELVAARPELAHARHPSGSSALAFAGYHRRPDVVDAVAAGRTDLDVFEAAILGRRERVRELVAADPAAASACAPDGFPVVGLAAHFGHAEVVRDLLAAGADPNARSRNPMGVRPLHAGLAHRDPGEALAVTRVLLDAGADANQPQEAGWTPLQQAAHHGWTEHVRLLLERGADPAARNAEGKTAADVVPAGADETAALLRTARGPGSS
jgi:ankyrin repeat protein